MATGMSREEVIAKLGIDPVAIRQRAESEGFRRYYASRNLQLRETMGRHGWKRKLP